MFVTVESHTDDKACRDVLTELPRLETHANSVAPNRDKAVQC